MDVAVEAIQYADFSITEGHRNQEMQDEHYREGKSQKQWPESTHNQQPSDAFHFVPYPFDGDWESTENWRRWTFIAGIMIGIGIAKRYKIRWGGDWSRDGIMTDQRFHDLMHIEWAGYMED